MFSVKVWMSAMEMKAPAKPAMKPVISTACQRVAATGMPALSALRGSSPTARTARPNEVWFSIAQISTISARPT